MSLCLARRSSPAQSRRCLSRRSTDRRQRGDRVPQSVTSAIKDGLGVTVRETRKLTAVNGDTVFVSSATGNGFEVCLEIVNREEVGTSTCNSQDGISKGWLYIGDGQNFYGLVDESVTPIEITDAADTQSVTPANGVYSFPLPKTDARARLLRGDGTQAAEVAIPAMPARPGVATGTKGG
jgi:hypothetical protein